MSEPREPGAGGRPDQAGAPETPARRARAVAGRTARRVVAAARRAAHPDLRHVAAGLAVLVVALLGGLAGWALAPPTTAFVGPLEVSVRVVPSLDPGVEADLPPVGRVVFDTHDAPLAVRASVLSVDLDAAEQLISSPQAVLALQLSAPQTLVDATMRATAISGLCALLGAALAGALVYRSVLRAAETTASALVVLLASGGGAAATFDGEALAQPSFTGLLSRAPYIAGRTSSAAQRLESYRSGLSDIVQSVTALYAAADRLPVLSEEEDDVATLLHISDIHVNPLSYDLVARLVEQFGVDAVVDTGDVTTWGTPMESSTLSRIGELGVPYVFVRGNHDSAATEAAVASQPNAVVLDDEVREVAGLTFAGIGDGRFTPASGGSAADGAVGAAGEDVDGEEPPVAAAEPASGTEPASDPQQQHADRAEVGAVTSRLAGTVSRWEAEHPDDPVDVALVHDPSNLDSLFGEVPLVLAGHYHYRVRRLDDSGTWVMVEASTGGAGLSSAGLRRLSEGAPLNLTATLLYVVRSGPRAGSVLAYDEVTLGGLGLASVSVERTVLPPSGPVESAEPGPAGDGEADGDG